MQFPSSTACRSANRFHTKNPKGPALITTDSETPSPLLSLESVVVAFGGLVALKDVSVQVDRGERLAVLGPNGAGKTTLFNTIAGDITPTSGRVVIKGMDCTNSPSRVRPRLGVARTYQKTRLLGGLTVSDNLYLAQTGKHGRHRALWSSAADVRYMEIAKEAAAKIWLGDHVDTLVSDLSHGQQRQLEIGLALVTEPDLMLLDEPASGLSKGERERLIDLIEALDKSTTLVLIEHDMDVALRVADRVIVMSDGSLVAQGSPDEIRQDPVVADVYLGNVGH